MSDIETEYSCSEDGYSESEIESNIDLDYLENLNDLEGDTLNLKRSETPFTKYELVKALVLRVKELESGAAPKLRQIKSEWSPVQIAERELEENLLDVQIVREYPDGTNVVLN